MTSGLFNLLRRAGAQLNVSPTKKQGEPANIATITVAIDFYLYPLDKRHKVHYYMPPLTGFVCIGISELRKSWALQHLFVYLLILLLILFACRFFFMINDAALVFFHSNFVVSVNFCFNNMDKPSRPFDRDSQMLCLQDTVICHISWYKIFVVNRCKFNINLAPRDLAPMFTDIV